MSTLLQTFVYSFICLFVYLFIPISGVFASGEFRADYDVQYAVAPSGITIVTQNVTLTNQATNLYPQKYSILIDSVKINNVIAYDPGGKISADIVQKDGKTEIGLTFNEKNVGLGKQLRFTLRYESTDIAAKNGSIWEINIPGVASDPDLFSYEVSLKVPGSFGTNAYMSPLPARVGKWTKEQMTRGGISAAYGKEQLFDVSLSYYLENTSLAPTTSEIALPPDTAFQKVQLRSLEPKPRTVLVDADGNWLAQYDLSVGQRIAIEAQLTIRVRLEPFPDEEESEREIDAFPYTRPLKYWETTDTAIQELAKQYTTPEDIYQYVVSVLSYDYKRAETGGTRKGALGALAAPSTAICMEFTDLFIAIARAAGIPAREVVGYSYTSNARLRPLSLVSDVLHAWPEYYDKDRKLWIPIDPTWADTTGGINYFDKLDFNHIVFAVLGRSSEYPYPAGFYKKSGSQKKDVAVAFAATDTPFKNSPLQVTYEFPKSVTAGLTTQGSVLIQNEGMSAAGKTTVAITSMPAVFTLERTYDQIPPLATISLPIAVSLPHYFQKSTGTIVTSVNGTTTQYTFDIQPIVYRYIGPLIGGVLVVIILFIMWLKSLRLWKR